MKSIHRLVAAVFTVGSLVASAAAPPPKDQVEVTALPSANGVAPVSHSGSHPEWFYDLNVTSGVAYSDTICALFTMTDKNGMADSFTFGFNVAGSSAIAVTPNPASVLLTDSGVVDAAGPTQQACFQIGVQATEPGDFATNIQINVTPARDASRVQLSHDTIHLHVHATAAPTMTCFVTDSNFDFLLDCANAVVASGNGGRFTIQVNKSKAPVEVSTQPGQFYYNALWQNGTGADRTVRVVFKRQGVHPHGAQAIHASVFPTAPAMSGTNFDVVNNDIPSGTDDVLDNVVVPAGTVLWTDYHLEWDGIGYAAPANLATSCGGANQSWMVSATVYDTQGTADPSDDAVLAGPCAGGASGFKK